LKHGENVSLKNTPKVSLKNSTLGGQDEEKSAGSTKAGMVLKPARPVRLGILEKVPKTRRRGGRALKNSYPDIRRRELLKSRRVDQVKLKMQGHCQNITSNRIFTNNKVSMPLHHIVLLDRLCLGFGRILVITRHMITTWYTFNHILFNILFHIQIMVHHNYRLLLIVIWPKAMHMLMLEDVRGSKQNLVYLRSRWCTSGLSHT
jgi:hypothetical protein